MPSSEASTLLELVCCFPDGLSTHTGSQAAHTKRFQQTSGCQPRIWGGPARTRRHCKHGQHADLVYMCPTHCQWVHAGSSSESCEACYGKYSIARSAFHGSRCCSSLTSANFFSVFRFFNCLLLQLHTWHVAHVRTRTNIQVLHLNVGGHDKVKIKCKIGVPDSVGYLLSGLFAFLGRPQCETAVWRN